MAKAKEEVVLATDEINVDEALEACRQIEKEKQFIWKAKSILEKSLKVKAESDALEKQKANKQTEIDGLGEVFEKAKKDKQAELDKALLALADRKTKAELELKEFEESIWQRKGKATKEIEWLESQIKTLSAEKGTLAKGMQDARKEGQAAHEAVMAARKKEQADIQAEIDRLRGVLDQIRKTAIQEISASIN